MTPEESIYSLMAMAEAQQQAATVLLDGLRSELAQLGTTRRAIAVSVNEAAHKGTRDALASAPVEAARVLDSASTRLVSAAVRVESAGRRLGWRSGAVLAGGCLVLVGGSLALSWCLTPSPEEIAGLRATVATLEAKGGLAKLQHCGKAPGRLCVEVDTRRPGPSGAIHSTTIGLSRDIEG